MSAYRLLLVMPSATHSPPPTHNLGDLLFPTSLATPTTKNIKTGNVPTIAIGATREESLDSCRAVGCPMLHKKHGGQGGGGEPLCYSQNGTPSFSHA